MTGRAGRASQLAVIQVACIAAQAFVDTNWSAVVARSNLLRCARCMALVAQRLQRVRADLHQAIAVFHFGQAQTVDRNRFHFPAIE